MSVREQTCEPLEQSPGLETDPRRRSQTVFDEGAKAVTERTVSMTSGARKIVHPYAVN